MNIPDSEVIQHYPSGKHSAGYQHTQDDEIQLGTAIGLLHEVYRTIPDEDKHSAIIYGLSDFTVTYPWRLSREEVVTRRLKEIDEQLQKAQSGIAKDDLQNLITSLDQIGSGYEDMIQIYPTESNPSKDNPQGVNLKDFIEFLVKLKESVPSDPISKAEIRANVKGWLKVRVNYRDTLDAAEKLEKYRSGLVNQLKIYAANGGMTGDDVSQLRTWLSQK